MSRRLFTPSEVQALIPALELIFGQLTVLHAERQALRRQASAGGAAALATRGPERVDTLTRDIANLESQIDELGGELKDFEQGLVDFPCQRGSEVVLLCWQYGEKRLGFWHGEDEGFGGRKPLDADTPQAAILMN